MNPADRNENLKKAKIALWLNLPCTIVAMMIALSSTDNGVLWKTVASWAGFSVFLGVTILVLRRIIKLKNLTEHRSPTAHEDTEQ